MALGEINVDDLLRLESFRIPLAELAHTYFCNGNNRLSQVCHPSEVISREVNKGVLGAMSSSGYGLIATTPIFLMIEI